MFIDCFALHENLRRGFLAAFAEGQRDQHAFIAGIAPLCSPRESAITSYSFAQTPHVPCFQKK